jgi:hypothetical protein
MVSLESQPELKEEVFSKILLILYLCSIQMVLKFGREEMRWMWI